MIKIIAELTPDTWCTTSADWNEDDTMYRLHLRITTNGDYMTAAERTMSPYELFTKSIFDRIFDHLKNDLLKEFEKQETARQK